MADEQVITFDMLDKKVRRDLRHQFIQQYTQARLRTMPNARKQLEASARMLWDIALATDRIRINPGTQTEVTVPSEAAQA